MLSSGGRLLEGTVRVSGTKSLATSGEVWLIPADETKWRAPLTWFYSRISDNVSCTVYAAPGDYLVIAGEDVSRRLSTVNLDAAEDYIREHAPGAQRITLKAGERKSVELEKPQ